MKRSVVNVVTAAAATVAIVLGGSATASAVSGAMPVATMPADIDAPTGSASLSADFNVLLQRLLCLFGARICGPGTGS